MYVCVYLCWCMVELVPMGMCSEVNAKCLPSADFSVS